VSIDEEKFRAWAQGRSAQPLPILRPTTPEDVQAEADQITEWLRQLP